MCVLSAFRAERAKCASSLLSELKGLSVHPLCAKCASSLLLEMKVLSLRPLCVKSASSLCQVCILCAFRAHCDAINELCCQHYNGHATRTSKMVQSKHTYDFRIGDKICFCKNGQVLNKGTQLRAYLQDYPDILEALGIIKSRDKESAKEDGSMDIMTAVEQILDDDGEHSLEEMQPVSAAGNRRCSLGGGSLYSPPISSDAGAHGGGEGGAMCASQPASSAERKQHQCACSQKALLNSSSVVVKEEESWCDEHLAAAAALCERGQEKGAVQQEPPWVREHSADYVGGHCSVDYAVKATDFGLTMERLSQSPGPAISISPSVSAGGGRHGRQSRLGQAGGAEGLAAGRGWNPLPQEEGDESSSPPQSSQDDEEEEETVGKLKDGIVRLCNGEVYFIMDVRVLFNKKINLSLMGISVLLIEFLCPSP